MKHTKVLLYGNVGYIDQTFLKHAFRNANILILGETQVQRTLLSGVTILPFSGDSKEIYEVFDSYEFDQIVYFSEYLSYKNEVYGEVERLRTILELCRKQENVKLLYINGPYVDNGMYENTVIQRSIYSLVEEYSTIYHVDVKLLYTPYLYSLRYKKDYIHQMTENLIQLERFDIHENEEHIVVFISLDDLSDLIYRILDSWKPGRDVLSVEDYLKVPIHELVDLMRNHNKKIKVQYGEDGFSILLPKSDVDIRKEYGWFQKYSILSEYKKLYDDYTKVNAFARKVLGKRKKKKADILVKYRKVIEVIVLFLLVEILELLTNGRIQFVGLDFRLVLVAIVSIKYGPALGVFSSVLVSFGFVFEYLFSGNSWHTLFYNLDSWMPMVVYLFVGSLCGYFQMHKYDDFKLVQYEKSKLEGKYNFTKQLYNDIILDKKMMMNEITGMRDGMGKISAVIKKLSSCDFLEMGEVSKEILKEWFETDSIEFYFFKKNEDEEYIFEKEGIDLSKYPLVEMDLLDKGIFSNTKAVANHPIYSSLLHVSNNLYGLFWIKQVSPEHITLYDRNALQMLSGIIEAIMTKKYYLFVENDTKNAKSFFNCEKKAAKGDVQV